MAASDRSRLLGIGFALSAFTMWVVADAAIKLAGEAALPPYEIVAVESLVLALLLTAFRGAQRDLKSLWPKQPGRQSLRACLDLANILCVAVALRHLPLTEFYIVVFAAPMVIAVGAWLVLQETLHAPQAIAILLGFAGVVVAVRPFAPHPSGDWTGYAACAVSVLCFSASIVWLRKMTQTERLDSLAFFSAFIAATAGGFAMLFHAVPLNLRLVAMLAAIGIAVGAGNYFSFRALRSIGAATVSQYHYSQLVSGGAIAWAIWHEQPTWSLAAGAFLIIGSGIYVASHSRLGED